jgi:patatin-like phospholipase/acyl hydrolase
MRDAARATSAAPTYFPSAEIKNINAWIKLLSLIDGGVGMNSPSKLVIDNVKQTSLNNGLPSNYFLLSLGTGKLPCY